MPFLPVHEETLRKLARYSDDWPSGDSDAAEAALMEIERLRREVAAHQFTAGLGPRVGKCSWCGMEMHGTSDAVQRMRQHQRECPEHPMAALLTAARAMLAVHIVGITQEQDAAYQQARDALLLAVAKVEGGENA